jgi:hypothetical protein
MYSLYLTYCCQADLHIFSPWKKPSFERIFPYQIADVYLSKIISLIFVENKILLYLMIQENLIFGQKLGLVFSSEQTKMNCLTGSLPALNFFFKLS